MPNRERALRLASFALAASVLAIACGGGGGASPDAGSGAAGQGGAARGGTSGAGPGGGGNSGGGTSGGGSGGGITSRFSCALAAQTALTARYFVDFAAGSDAADGRGQATAWKHAPGDAAATGTAAATTLVPGDAIAFRGGVRYLGSIDVPASGSSAAPIVYDGNSRGTWGTGLAIIDGEGTRTRGVSLNNKSFVVLDSFDLRAFSKAQSSTAVAISGGGNNEVRNCRISDVYYPTNPNPGGTAWEKQSGNGITANNSPGTRITHNSVRDVGNAGISWSAGSGVQVDGGEISCNEITNMNWGIAIALGNSTAGTRIRNVKVLGNYIHDFDQYYVASVWHRDGIFVFARPDTDQATVENLEIAYNYFEDNTSAFGSTAWIYIEYVCTGFDVHHNVLGPSRSYFAIRVLGDGFQVAGNHVFANNVIANANGMGIGMHVQESTGIKLWNNVFYDDAEAYEIHTSSVSGFAADYNLIYRRDGGSQVVILNAGPAENPAGNGYTFSQLAPMTGNEMHGLSGDPMFAVDPAIADADPSGYAPKPSSPAVDHGSDRGYGSDFAGNPIPGGGGPDIGAFER